MTEASSSSRSGDDSATAERYTLAKTILGADVFQRINTAKILVVGAGGIGCELLKNLVLTGFGDIEIIDLDTIDLSNLNRQFLFQKQHIKKPKSLVAKQTAASFNPLVNIVAHHANIKEPRFGVAYFQRFDLVLNALDNLDARRWVNRMCIAADVALIESGTTGFLGQVQPIRPGVTECYDCVPKPTPKTFPVCTIRSTPSTPIHCIVWAKSWLFTQLFGADDETEDEQLDKAIADGEDAAEIDSLRKEQREMRDMRAALIKAAAERKEQDVRSVAERIFNKVYKNDIDRLLGMEEMWTHRPVKPVPLVFADVMAGQCDADDSAPAPAGGEGESNGAAPSATNASTLKDQRQLTLRDNAELFVRSVSALATRASADVSVPLSFDKDDDAALDLVTAASNLRSAVYHIERKTRFEVKQMAGNIIPAIASTNAIVAGMLVVQAVHVLQGAWDRARNVSLARGSDRMLTAWPPAPPNPHCGVCQDAYMPVSVTNLELTLEEVVSTVAQAVSLEDVVVYDGSRILADPDFDDNNARSLAALGLVDGSILTLTDEDQQFQAVNVVLSLNAEADRPVTITGKTRTLAPRAQPAPQNEPDSSDDELHEVQPPPPRKRARDDDPAPAAKKSKPTQPAPAPAPAQATGTTSESAIALG